MKRTLFQWFRRGALLATMAAALPSMLHAGYIPGVTLMDASPFWRNGFTASTPDVRKGEYVLNEIGLFGDFVTTYPGGAFYLSTNYTGWAPGKCYMVFDLGSVRSLDAIKFWNYNEGGVNMTRRGVKSTDICYSADGVNYTTNPAVSLAIAPRAFAAFPQTISMGVSARYVRLNFNTNYAGGTLGADLQIGLSKVRFIDNSEPPRLVSASRNFLSNQVTAVFSEPVDAASALALTNYTLQGTSGSASILGASMGLYSNSVVLQTTALLAQNYALHASHVYDAAHVIAITNNSQVAVPRDLALWLKADAGVVETSGYVSQWTDQSGNGNNAVQANSAAQPFLNAGVANGLPAIYFNGSASFLEAAHSPSLTLNGDITVLMVMNPDDLGAIHSPISKTGGIYSTTNGNNMPAPFDIQIKKTAGNPILVWGNQEGAAPPAFTAGVGLAPGQFQLVSFVVRGTNATSYINGNFTGAAVLTSAPWDAGNPLRLGMRADLTGTPPKLKGYLAEVMVFRGTVSEADRVALDNYLGPKYGISVIPLVLTEVPANTTAQAGQTATFWVNALASSPTINYQWKKNSVNISGATNATYATPALTLGDSGSIYSVFVSTSIASSNSPNATLTVVADAQAPRLASATRLTPASTDIVVRFSEEVGSAEALNAANYFLDKGAAVVSVAAGDMASRVVLTTSGMLAGETYTLRASKVRDAFSNVMAPAAVPVLNSGVAMWLKADSGVVVNNAGGVAQWLDQGTNGNNANQFLSADYRPELASGAVNGMPAIRFNGMSNFLEAASSPSLAIVGNLTILVVANFTDLASPRGMVSKALGNMPASYDYYAQTGGSAMSLFRGNGSSYGYSKATSLPSIGVPHLMTVRMSGTNVTHFLDGKGNGGSGISTTLGDAGKGLRVGARHDFAQFMYGDIAEVLLFGSAIPDAERVALDNYLGVKYFPFNITQQPSGAGRLEGETATFQVGAEQGSANFLIQWQKNLVDIPGATNTTYTTPLLAQSDNSASYRAVLVVSGWSTNYSDPALVTVSADTVPPTLLSAGKTIWSSTRIVLTFSEAVDPSNIASLANYTLDKGATVLAAAMGDTPNQVVLTTTVLAQGTAYSLTVRNVKDLFNNTMIETPGSVSLYPAPALWLRADAGVTADGSGLVTQWDDQSGNANHALQPYGLSPALAPAAINGKPALHFNGSTYMFVPNSPSVAITGDMAAYAVVNIEDFASPRSIFGKTLANMPAPYDWYLWPDRMEFYRGNGSVYGYVRTYTMPSAGSPHVLAVNMRGTTANQYLDGRLSSGTTVIDTPIADNNDSLGIGTRNDLANYMKGDIAEIMIFPAALSAADSVRLDAYFGEKYGVMMGATPRLEIHQAGEQVVISWPTPVVAFTLQSAGNLSAPYWEPVSAIVTSANGTDSVTLSPGPTSVFFRLVR